MKPVIAALLSLSTLVACQGHSPPGAAPASESSSHRPGKPVAPADAQLLLHADTVRDVAADLVLVITPSSPVDRLRASISGTEGLELEPLQLDLGPLAAGEAQRQDLQVTRRSAGPGQVRVLLETWRGESHEARARLLPVRGGEEIAEKATTSPQLGPGGEAILSLPATESR